MPRRSEPTEKQLQDQARHEAVRLKQGAGTSPVTCQLADAIARDMKGQDALEALELLRQVNDERKTALARSMAIRSDLLLQDRE